MTEASLGAEAAVRSALGARIRVEERAVAKRPQGTGSLFVRTDKRGHESWYAQRRVDGRLVKKRLRPSGGRLRLRA